MHNSGEDRKVSSGKFSVRRTLADSHVAAAILAVLLFWSLDGTFEALWPLISWAGVFAFTAIAIRDIPYFSSGEGSLMLTEAAFRLYTAIVSLAAAFLLSRWVFGVGPFRALMRYYDQLKEGEDA